MIIIFSVFILQTYHDSMAKLKILTEDELKQIFGPIDTLKPLHQGSFDFSLINMNDRLYDISGTHEMKVL